MKSLTHRQGSLGIGYGGLLAINPFPQARNQSGRSPHWTFRSVVCCRLLLDHGVSESNPHERETPILDMRSGGNGPRVGIREVSSFQRKGNSMAPSAAYVSAYARARPRRRFPA